MRPARLGTGGKRSMRVRVTGNAAVAGSGATFAVAPGRAYQKVVGA